MGDAAKPLNRLRGVGGTRNRLDVGAVGQNGGVRRTVDCNLFAENLLVQQFELRVDLRDVRDLGAAEIDVGGKRRDRQGDHHRQMQQYHHGAAQCPRRLDPFRIGALGISLSLTGFRRLADN